MGSELIKIFQQIIDIISQSENLSFDSPKLPIFQGIAINTPIGDVIPLLLSQPSLLPNQLINLDLLDKFVKVLNQKKAIIRLNHIGFCYKVESQEKEKARIVSIVKQSSNYLYQEKSNDPGLWLYIGDIEKWEDPLIELLPIENTNDSGRQYWLPHVQIDIDTTLGSEDIKSIVYFIFGDKIRSSSLSIDSTTYSIRNRLGVINGVNIFLDIATNARNVKYTRQEMWKKVV